jgi:hypothetical protein
MFDYHAFLRLISICDLFADPPAYHGMPWDVGRPRPELNVWI